MSKTIITDILIPTVWEPYIIQRTADYSVFVESGIIGMDPEFDTIAGGGGLTDNMPFYNDLTGTRQIMSDAADLDVNKITTGKDICRLQKDANAWSVNSLAKWLSGDDPMSAIGSLIGEYWAREDADILIASIKGVLAALDAESGDPNLSKIASESNAGQSDATKLNASTFIDSLLKLGDRQDRVTALAIHSTTEAALKKADLIDYLPDSTGKASLSYFQGRRIIIDDRMPVRDGTTDAASKVYTSLLFGTGFFAKGSAPLSADPLEGGFGSEGLEYARKPLGHDSLLINRRRFILHPRGIKWNESSVAGTSPTNAELATAANWTRVYESKNVRVIGLMHNN